MGPYLAKPKTDIHISSGENERYIYCNAEMQGWRKTQEDAHISILNYDNNTAFFGVFDGHGGEEVSKYCALHLPDFLKKSPLFKENIIEALENSFLKFDSRLKLPDVIKELNRLACLDEEYDIDDEETSILKKEALMPLDQIMQNGVNSSESKNEESKTEEVNNSNEKSQLDTDSSDSNQNGKQKDTELVAEESKENEEASSSSGLKSKNLLKSLKSEIYKAFLNDYNSEDDDDEEEVDEEDVDDDDDDEADEEDEENECSDSSEDEISNDNPFQYKSSEPGKESGCTAIVAIIRDKTLYVANIGDSRCILSREGTAIEMSEDHKPEDEKEKTRITNAGGQITTDGRVNGGLNLSRAFGDHDYKVNEKLSDKEQMITAFPDIKTQELIPEKDEFLFLACDGIWNSMSSQEVVSFISERLKKDQDLKSICEELFKACLAPNTDGDGSGCDNMTCILVKFKDLNACVKRELDSSFEDNNSSNDHSKENHKKMKADYEDLFKPGSSKS